ncbi:hypothetical protein, partial [Streptomyces sp. NPDC096068]|uniref:hypothetical protein n=1 Tax=Streptomyces sp. NPDC096068 TaxID=3155424 RepID=UPI003321E0C6
VREDRPQRAALLDGHLEWKPSAVYEPRISADEAETRLARFRAEVAALLERPGATAADGGAG